MLILVMFSLFGAESFGQQHSWDLQKP